MVEYKRVAQAGAAGSLGATVFKALIEAGFEVTALVRTAGKLPSEHACKYKEVVVDFSSVASLTEALRGQDALVSTVGATGLAGQDNMVRAAVAAGVKRVLPSEYGCDISQPATHGLMPFLDKIKTAALVEAEAAKQQQLTYTFVTNNIFLDWCLEYGLLGDLRTKRAATVDGGNHRGSLTRLATVAAAVVAVLRNPDLTANQRVRVHDGALSHNEVLEAIKDATGPDGWVVEDEASPDVKAKSDQALAKGVFEPWVFVGYIRTTAFSPAAKADFTGRTWNEKLGIKEYSPDETKGLIKDIVKGILAASK
ncbi:hypothetical protein MGG_12714 [Pyricularia oryzae 70-15]|uniref:NAD(P)-binding domain-containing protein n=1 Tax=Pyricularia oryzae (strain 70-15 / ATCC MYA-4617 / FGSC 8958) TaxID=242507 RepID=G4N8W7_PYRO7|nr:uncharacterized protein MGG_12714 [Pyricularia oryzae 70-15]EHA50261.1 hypothetical protein MGG_12714 [Pyricularia oryzae 70-15]KAI7911830.1 hypothetical protein M0657_010752 [Pyricularia oryzae]KAI7928824.1 hypothetical protein M9X92_001618 [Pyricularia oryzae]